ncbi:MAG: ABC transporter permease subunit [Oscillospiraceae bacterium]|nr:ABC transporter permease subunit [Oscillospiraceae bacterium]
MKHRACDGFAVVCAVLTAVSLLIVCGNVAVIVFRGAKSLPECLTQPETLFALRLSVKSACISTFACFLLAIPTAYTLTRTELPGRRVVEIALELTMSLPYIVLGLSLLILFSSPAGKLLKSAGFPVVFSQNGVIAAQLTVNLPFAVRLSAAAFQSVEKKLECVAGLLGAAPARRFFTVLLPLCRHSLISAVILVWSRALGEFGATLMLVGVTRMKTETLPGSIYLAVSTNDLNGALASAFILLCISALSLLAANLLSRTGKKRSRYG